jgi:hypothetical protein
MTANEKRVAALYSNVLGIPADAIGAHGKFAGMLIGQLCGYPAIGAPRRVLTD